MAVHDEDGAHDARMRAILRWRRVVNLVCMLLAIYALVVLLRAASPMPRATVMLAESLCAFIVAGLVAVNVFTIRARR